MNASRQPSRFANNADGLIGFYNFILGDRGISMPPHLIPVARALMDFRIDKLMVTIGPGSGKSLLLSTVFPAFILGQDPSMTIIGISAGEGLMQGFVRGVMEWMKDSPRWKAAFPNVGPNKEAGWSVTKGMFVTGRKPGDSDASYRGFGIDSSELTGKHARQLIIDDLHDKDNSSTADACKKIQNFYYDTIMGRQDPQGCRMVCAGRRWHTEDLYGHFSKSGDWVHMNLPAIRENETTLYWDISIPEGMVCCFND